MVICYQFPDPIGVHNLRSCQLPGAAKPSIRGNAITKTEASSDNRAGANGLNGFAEHSRKMLQRGNFPSDRRRHRPSIRFLDMLATPAYLAVADDRNTISPALLGPETASWMRRLIRFCLSAIDSRSSSALARQTFS
jgi:hypothetical protein